MLNIQKYAKGSVLINAKGVVVKVIYDKLFQPPFTFRGKIISTYRFGTKCVFDERDFKPYKIKPKFRKGDIVHGVDESDWSFGVILIVTKPTCYKIGEFRAKVLVGNCNSPYEYGTMISGNLESKYEHFNGRLARGN